MGDAPPLEVFKRVKGLDCVAGLSRALGKNAQYVSALQCFADGQRGMPGRIRQALDERDWATAERLARTCRALSGSIGALELPNSAGALEHAIKHRMSPDVIAPQLMEFDLLLGKLVADLDAALAQHAI